MSLARRHAGAIAHAQGDAFELRLAYHHAAALRAGLLADVRHVSPRMRAVRQGRGIRWVVVGHACCDYVGTLGDGRALVVEAKSTGDARLAYSQIEPQQVAQLAAVSAAGGLALLVVEYRAVGAIYAVPWREVPWRRSGRGLSLSPADMPSRRVTGDCYLRALVRIEAPSDLHPPKETCP